MKNIHSACAFQNLRLRMLLYIALLIFFVMCFEDAADSAPGYEFTESLLESHQVLLNCQSLTLCSNLCDVLTEFEECAILFYYLNYRRTS